jgi:hypothetical protein
MNASEMMQLAKRMMLQETLHISSLVRRLFLETEFSKQTLFVLSFLARIGS